MSVETQTVKNIIEAALLAYGQPLNVDRLQGLFTEDDQVSRQEIRDALLQLQQDCENRCVELVEVGSGYRYQARKDYAQWVSRLWEEKPPRYSRALLETLVLVAYRQPITRAEVEDIRGVSVSSHIMKTLQERDWVRVVGHKDVPGKPALYATTKAFLDYFNLKSLDELPSLMEIRDLDKINLQGELPAGQTAVNAEIQDFADEPEERLLPDGEADHGDGAETETENAIQGKAPEQFDTLAEDTGDKNEGMCEKALDAAEHAITDEVVEESVVEESVVEDSVEDSVEDDDAVAEIAQEAPLSGESDADALEYAANAEGTSHEPTELSDGSDDFDIGGEEVELASVDPLPSTEEEVVGGHLQQDTGIPEDTLHVADSPSLETGVSVTGNAAEYDSFQQDNDEQDLQGSAAETAQEDDGQLSSPLSYDDSSDEDQEFGEEEPHSSRLSAVEPNP